MRKDSFLARSLILALVLGLGAFAWGCDGDGGNEDADATDVPHDDVVSDDYRPDDVTPDDVIQPDDVPMDDIVSDEVIEEDVPPDDLACPGVCQTAPTGGEIGAACVSSATCDHAAECLTESVESFNGAMYVDSYGGTCVLYGAGSEGCDPEVPSTCPDGSNCQYMGTGMGQEYYGCWDSCEPVDTSRNPYEYNCGCRVGYMCDITSNACFSGCSHDRECCERWWDLNDDYARQADEVVVKEGCTNTCDNGALFEDGDPTLCQATFACINNGTAGTEWGDACEGDAWCPADGRCLDGYRYTDDVTGEPFFPGGYCIKDACNYVGRGCTDAGGACANLGSSDDPFYACVKPCHFGREITAADYECRSTPDAERQACQPAYDDFWNPAPTDGSDGFCWPPYNPGGAKGIGEVCADDEECVSPFGIGSCLEFTIEPMTPFCGLSCNDTAAVDLALCGGDIDPADPANNTATGACWSYICWEGCADAAGAAGGPLGANGCSSADNACYPTSMFGTYVKVGTGLTVPIGICVPKCTNDTWCSDFWGMAMACDTASGVCG
jgi:hypothetical protein